MVRFGRKVARHRRRRGFGKMSPRLAEARQTRRPGFSSCAPVSIGATLSAGSPSPGRRILLYRSARAPSIARGAGGAIVWPQSTVTLPVAAVGRTAAQHSGPAERRAAEDDKPRRRCQARARIARARYSPVAVMPPKPAQPSLIAVDRRLLLAGFAGALRNPS